VPVVRVSALAALVGEPRWCASIGELLDAVDSYIPVPDRYVSAPFLMPAESVLTITGRGTVVTGAIERGQVRVGDPVAVVGLGGALTTVVTGVETFGKTMEHAEAGDNAALLLRSVRRQLVRRGQVLAEPGSLAAHRRFEASVYLLPAAEGGRRTEVRTGYRPQFFVRTADVVGVMDLGPVGVGQPGDRLTVTIELGKPVALDVNLSFAIREGGRTVGAGTVIGLLD
jgi:elongation factor Tu